MGIKALLIEDAPLTTDMQVLHLSRSGARFDPVDGIVGLGVYEATPRLLEKYGDKVAIALKTPGGEMQLSAAGIQNLDKEKVPSRIAARGG